MFKGDAPYLYTHIVCSRKLYFPLGTGEGKDELPTRARPSDSHKLLALLEQKKMLLRVYSQNIDGTYAYWLSDKC